MHRLLSLLFAIGLAANGAYMLVFPASWYDAIPGVVMTGPLNVHFVRDIGCGFLTAAFGIGWMGAARRVAWPAALTGAVFLALHALVHVADSVAGREHAHQLLSELPTVFLPAAVVLWLARPDEKGGARVTSRPRTKAAGGLFARLVERKLGAFERDFDYDVSYLREIARTSPRGFIRFAMFTSLSEHQEGAPDAAMFAAKIASTLHEDCGPCTQLVVHMAERRGVPHADLRAMLAGDVAKMSEDAAIGFELAQAVLARDLLRADALRARARERWGDRAVVSLAFAIASAKVYPTVKYALGHGRACSRVLVGEEVAPLARTEARA